MGMLLLEARFVIMLIAGVMHQVQLIHQPAFFKKFERSIDRDAIEFRVFFLGQPIETLGVQMQTGVVDQVEQDAALASQPDASFAQGIRNAGVWHG